MQLFEQRWIPHQDSCAGRTSLTGLVALERNKLQTASPRRGMSFVGQVQSRDL